jgi:DnaK suppressor protein
MTDKTTGLEKAFLDRQQSRLLKLQAQISGAMDAGQAEESGTQQQSLGEAQELEDDAQRLSLLDVEESLLNRNTQRLQQVRRALEKIKDGTYGFSDASGKPIPRDRLEAVPEALFTADEQGARDRVASER